MQTSRYLDISDDVVMYICIYGIILEDTIVRIIFETALKALKSVSYTLIYQNQFSSNIKYQIIQ